MISAPKNIYGPTLFKAFVHELGGPKLVAKKLDVSERSVWRWLKEDSAPKMAVLSLYWESQYGRSLIDVEHHHEICLMLTRIKILEDQFVRAKDVITGMKLLNYGTANEPLYDERGEFDSHNSASILPGQATKGDTPNLSKKDQVRKAERLAWQEKNAHLSSEEYAKKVHQRVAMRETTQKRRAVG